MRPWTDVAGIAYPMFFSPQDASLADVFQPQGADPPPPIPLRRREEAFEITPLLPTGRAIHTAKQY